MAFQVLKKHFQIVMPLPVFINSQLNAWGAMHSMPHKKKQEWKDNNDNHKKKYIIIDIFTICNSHQSIYIICV
ncbi:hypothetical protein GM30_15475 [Trabulsiella odontotermitis]|nr:hypothetical protein GM30_15475 [Trabulsiella odontotermitis]